MHLVRKVVIPLGPKERKEREREERRELILSTATDIIATEGIDSLSVRKIANKIEYSPSIIYHYFKDKDDILNQLMKRGYQKILNALASAQGPADNPEQKLEKLIRNYINVALQMPDEYMTVQLNTSPAILEHTSSLFKGASARKPALGILFQCLKDIYKDKNLDDNLIELTAQVIAAGSFGLIIRLIIEKDTISENQRTNLIEHFIKVTLNGIVLGKSLGHY